MKIGSSFIFGWGCLPVYRFVVSLVGNDFWGEIVGCTAEGPCLVGDTLGEAKVGDFEMAMAVEKQVFRLQISVDDILGVQIFQCQSSFGSIKLGNGVGETLHRVGASGLASRESIKGTRCVTGERRAIGPTPDFLSREKSSPPSTKSMTM